MPKKKMDTRRGRWPTAADEARMEVIAHMMTVEALLTALDEALGVGDIEAAKRLTRQIRDHAARTKLTMQLVKDGKWRG